VYNDDNINYLWRFISCCVQNDWFYSLASRHFERIS